MKVPKVNTVLWAASAAQQPEGRRDTSANMTDKNQNYWNFTFFIFI